MIIGSDSGWLMLAGIMARPAATSARTNSGVTNGGIAAPKDSPSAARAAWASRPMFSRTAMYSISAVMSPARA